MAEVNLLSDPSVSIKVRGMKTRDEDIFLRADLVKTGKVFSELIRRCCENLPSDPDDMLTGDRYALLIEIAAETHGPNYKFKIDCPFCQAKQEASVDILALGRRTLPNGTDGLAPFQVGPLPKSKKTILCRRMTGRDEMRMFKTRQSAGDGMRGFATSALLLHIVDTDISITDATKKPLAGMFVDDLESADSSFIRQACMDADCGIETTIEMDCNSCIKRFEAEVQVGSPDFFLRLPQRRNG